MPLSARVTAVMLWCAAVAGMGLSVTSLLKICNACSETGRFSIFGMNFGWFGIVFFGVMIVAAALYNRYMPARWAKLFLVFAAAGAEARFIWLQKYVIGQWCPVCLGIAAAVAVAGMAILYDIFRQSTNQGGSMKPVFRQMLLVVAAFAIGLAGATIGVRSEAEASIDTFLGKTNSPVVVYFVSDWFCPGCRKIEPEFERMYAELSKSVKLSFVDYPIHKETLNFTPYNLQFMTYEKAKYIHLRRALSALAVKTKNPTPEEVQAAVAPLGVKLRQMDYADVLYGMQADLMVYRGYAVKGTPSVVVVNTKTKKSKVLFGEREISLKAVKDAIKEVQ
jgi:thiol-disulfide isomerase/thioredoxin